MRLNMQNTLAETDCQCGNGSAGLHWQSSRWRVANINVVRRDSLPVARNGSRRHED